MWRSPEPCGPFREFEIEGVATTIPADIAILEHPDFQAGEHSTKWVEEVLDLSGVSSSPATRSDANDDEPKIRRNVDVEVNGKRFAVAMWVPESAMAAAPAAGAKKARRRSSAVGATGSGSGDVTVPMQGTVVKVVAEVGQTVAVGDTIVVLEAMKMENNVNAEKAGTVVEIKVAAGDRGTAATWWPRSNRAEDRTSRRPNLQPIGRR